MLPAGEYRPAGQDTGVEVTAPAGQNVPGVGTHGPVQAAEVRPVEEPYLPPAHTPWFKVEV